MVCRQTACDYSPADGGGATCFADLRAAFDELDPQTQARLETLECLCSFAHHEAKYHSVSPEWGMHTANPPVA